GSRDAPREPPRLVRPGPDEPAGSALGSRMATGGRPTSGSHEGGRGRPSPGGWAGGWERGQGVRAGAALGRQIPLFEDRQMVAGVAGLDVGERAHRDRLAVRDAAARPDLRREMAEELDV